MKTEHSGSSTRTTILLVAALAFGSAIWGLFNEDGLLRGQANTPAVQEPSPIFTPAHRTVGEAMRHFFMLESEPVQPIPYSHVAHIELAGLTCVDCHDAVGTGPIAHIPSVALCMDCHDFIATESPAVQMLAAYWERGEEPPWQRVYGWPEEAHVRFNHAPHFRAKIDCSTCHGDVARMTVAEKVVEHTMSFCINCHEKEQASNDCLVCHY